MFSELHWGKGMKMKGHSDSVKMTFLLVVVVSYMGTSSNVYFEQTPFNDTKVTSITTM